MLFIRNYEIEQFSHFSVKSKNLSEKSVDFGVLNGISGHDRAWERIAVTRQQSLITQAVISLMKNEKELFYSKSFQ